MLYLQGITGILLFLSICCLCSENFLGIRLRLILIGLAIQISLAVLVLKFSIIRETFIAIGKIIPVLKNATLEGTSFVFGYVGGGTSPFLLKEDGNTFILAFQALPMVLVVSSISMVLFYWKILPLIVNAFSWILQHTLGIGGALGVCAAAKIFFGQTEAPLLIRPYLNKLSRSELFTVMTLGMATTSGTVMALYTSILYNTIPNILTHIINASIISIPTAITLSRIIVPEKENLTSGVLSIPYEFTSTMDAITKGALDGGKLFLNLIVILIVFIALVGVFNKLVMYFFPYVNGLPLTLERILGYLLAPFTWLMGIPWSEAHTTGSLLGKKIILNEVCAFSELSNIPDSVLSFRSRLIMTYALCGFANLSSIGIQIGGLGTVAPERRNDIISLGFKALLAGTLSTMISGTIVGLLTFP